MSLAEARGDELVSVVQLYKALGGGWPDAMCAMHHGRSFLAVLFLLSGLGAATPAIAAEDTSPPAVTSHEINVVRQVAIALADRKNS